MTPGARCSSRQEANPQINHKNWAVWHRADVRGVADAVPLSISCDLSEEYRTSASPSCTKSQSDPSPGDPPLRVAGVDDWSWRKGHTYGPSSSTSSRGPLSRSSTIVRRPGRPNGSDSIPRSKSSAAIDAVSTRRARETARTRRGRSLTGSTYCRTCAKRSKLNWAAFTARPAAPCCQWGTTTLRQ